MPREPSARAASSMRAACRVGLLDRRPLGELHRRDDDPLVHLREDLLRAAARMR